MLYNRLLISSVGIATFRSTKYKIQNKNGSTCIYQVPCGVQPSLTLFSAPITVPRPNKRPHLPLILYNISKTPYRSESTNVNMLLAPKVRSMAVLTHSGNFTIVASSGYELLTTLTRHKINNTWHQHEDSQRREVTPYSTYRAACTVHNIISSSLNKHSEAYVYTFWILETTSSPECTHSTVHRRNLKTNVATPARIPQTPRTVNRC
jgi:hypothetical protein